MSNQGKKGPGSKVSRVGYVPIEKGDKKGWKHEVGIYVYAVRRSKLTAVYPVRGASSREAAQVLQSFFNHARSVWNVELTLVQSDQGTQFLSIEWVRMCNKLGIKQRQCPTNAQAMNGQVERVQGILVSKMRALMHHTDTPTRFCPLAIRHALWIYNRTPNRALQRKTPWEVATGRKPDLNISRVFGCKAYAQIPKDQRRGKTQNPTWEGILVGYSETSPELIILDPKTLHLRNLFNVKFDEGSSGWKLMDNVIRSDEGRIFNDVIRSDEGRIFNDVIRSDEGRTTNKVNTIEDMEDTEDQPWTETLAGVLTPDQDQT